MTGNISEIVLQRFGIGAFAKTAKSKVAHRALSGKPKADGFMQHGFTIPNDLFHEDDAYHMYEVSRDNDGNFYFKKTRFMHTPHQNPNAFGHAARRKMELDE